MTNPLWINIKLAPGATAPVYKTAGAAGADLCAYLTPDAVVYAHDRPIRVRTGVSIKLPDGYEAQVRPRSGLSASGLIVIPGTVDADYIGEIGVLVYSLDGLRVIAHGDRLAQLVIAPVCRATWQVVDELGETERGQRGWGSTGVK